MEGGKLDGHFSGAATLHPTNALEAGLCKYRKPPSWNITFKVLYVEFLCKLQHDYENDTMSYYSELCRLPAHPDCRMFTPSSPRPLPTKVGQITYSSPYIVVSSC